ncbi:Anaphase-promoting complex subunit 23 [Chytridiales sp. JEL 0842]|nr:Anaphase-promoting complex subunit 23 [Chytridiales sp. JEL 0842]
MEMAMESIEMAATPAGGSSSSSSSNMRSLLRASISICSSRGLAADLLNGLEHHGGEDEDELLDFTSSGYSYPKPMRSAAEYDRYQLAISYFHTREYSRASHILSGCKHSQSLFLMHYSNYLAIQKSSMNSTGQEEVTSSKAKLGELFKDLKELINAPTSDAFLFYLLGVVSLKLSLRDDALSALVTSVSLYPYNWSAWLELSNCISSGEQLNHAMTNVPDSFVKHLFVVHVSAELTLKKFDGLEEILLSVRHIFPQSSFLLAKQGLLYYNFRRYGRAAEIFNMLYERDPFMLDFADDYANILFSMGNMSKLGHLAHRCDSIDRYRPETCATIAATYFKMATKLAPTKSAYWSLLGHEYTEMKNPRAGIEAYRRAVDINPRDYKAWYALGLGYENLKMPLYSIHYYQKAASLRPYDPRFWVALGSSYENVEQYTEAIRCYKRSLIGADQDSTEPGEVSTALLKLANLYKKTDINGNNASIIGEYLRNAIEEMIEDKYTGKAEYRESVSYMANWKLEQGLLEPALYYIKLIEGTTEGKGLMRAWQNAKQSMGK